MSIIQLSSLFELTLVDWLLAFLAAMLVGMSKSGFKGLGVIIVTTFALVFGAKSSTGLILPILIVGDIIAVIYYTRHTQWKYLLQMLPAMIVGVLIGVKVGEDLDESTFKQGMAVIILLSVGMMWWWDRRNSKKVPTHWLFGTLMGLGAGFTTMVGNLAGAFSNIYFLAMRLPKNQFIGTAAWLFFIINLFKLPFHIYTWKTIDIQTISVNLWLLSAVFLGFVLGLQIVKRIENNQYRKFILIVTAIGALTIFFK
ncbi:MAG: sulfite exporter TauE/SafE family protein [Saprospiraceae bacterium]